MNLLALIICSWFMWTCEATPVVIHHKPAPTEFTIDSVKVGAISMQATPNLRKSTHAKPAPIKVGGAAVTPPIVGEESLFAEIAPDGTVIRVIVIDQANIDTGNWGNPKNWVRTSASGAVRKNHAAVGYTYDKTLDAFITPKPSADATLDTLTARWVIPAKVITPEEILFNSSFFVASTTTK